MPTNSESNLKKLNHKILTLKDLYHTLAPLLPNAEHEARWLFAHFLNISKSQLPLMSDRLITEQEEHLLTDAFRRRAAGEPLQYITGLQPFWDMDLIVSPAVLIPRWDSESLLERVMQLLPKDSTARVADVCTGSGALALVIKSERPGTTVAACDISPSALTVARQNAEKYNLPVTFYQGDLLSALPHGDLYDLIICNPPYICDGADLPADVMQEPHSALFAGADGLDFYRRLTAEGIAERLTPGGHLILEIGCEQATAVSKLLKDTGLENIEVGQDLSGLDRWVLAQKP